jgi:hypothetical protein
LIQDVLDVALLVAKAVDATGGEYFIGGSVASSLQGEPRATNDIDFVVAMLGLRVPAFTAELGRDFEVDQAMLRDALSRGGSANIFYLPMVTKVDIFGLGSTPYDEVEFARRRRGRYARAAKSCGSRAPRIRFCESFSGTARAARSRRSSGATWSRCCGSEVQISIRRFSTFGQHDSA